MQRSTGCRRGGASDGCSLLTKKQAPGPCSPQLPGATSPCTSLGYGRWRQRGAADIEGGTFVDRDGNVVVSPTVTGGIRPRRVGRRWFRCLLLIAPCVPFKSSVTTSTPRT
jgi:hypothetical protein